MMGLAGTSHVELFFDDVVLGPECLLGEPGRGLALIFETLGRVRLAPHRRAGARARAAGAGRDGGHDANERRQFGRPIGEFQLVRQMLADSAMEIASARLLMLHTAWRIDRGEPAREGISMVKVQAAETLGRVADRAVAGLRRRGLLQGPAHRTDLSRRAHLPDLRRHVRDPPRYHRPRPAGAGRRGGPAGVIDKQDAGAPTSAADGRGTGLFHAGATAGAVAPRSTPWRCVCMIRTVGLREGRRDRIMSTTSEVSAPAMTRSRPTRRRQRSTSLSLFPETEWPCTRKALPAASWTTWTCRFIGGFDTAPASAAPGPKT